MRFISLKSSHFLDWDCFGVGMNIDFSHSSGIWLMACIWLYKLYCFMVVLLLFIGLLVFAYYCCSVLYPLWSVNNSMIYFSHCFSLSSVLCINFPVWPTNHWGIWLLLWHMKSFIVSSNWIRSTYKNSTLNFF